MSTFTPDSSVVERVEPSPNFDERTGLARPDMIVLHYTGMQSPHDALHRLCDPKARVSSHYLVLENGSILQFVPEAKRAWHAGVSSWDGDTDINSRSIGIEIANPGHDFGYPDFPKRQIAAVITLCRAILTRNIIRPRKHRGAFRRGAEPQAGSRREISVAATGPVRRRPLGRARADHRRDTHAAARRHRRAR